MSSSGEKIRTSAFSVFVKLQVVGGSAFLITSFTNLNFFRKNMENLKIVLPNYGVQ